MPNKMLGPSSSQAKSSAHPCNHHQNHHHCHHRYSTQAYICLVLAFFVVNLVRNRPTVLSQTTRIDGLAKKAYESSHSFNGGKSPTSGNFSNSTSSRSKYFHQILPPDSSKYTAWIKSWDAIDFDIRAVYGDDDLKRVVMDLGSDKLFRAWSSMARTIEKVDFARYAILYLYGGIYADADQELVNPKDLQSMMEWNTIVLPFEKGGSWNTHQVGQAIMISPYPKHPFWLDLMEYMVSKYNSSCNVLLNTGPLAMTNFWNENGENASSWRNNGVVRLTRLLDGRMDPTTYNSSVTIHHMGGSWVSTDHNAQLVACQGRIPQACLGCEEHSKQYS